MSLNQRAIDGLMASPHLPRFFAVHGQKVSVAIRHETGVIVGGIQVQIDGLALLALIDALSNGCDPRAAVDAMRESERTILESSIEPEQPRRKR